MRKFLAFGDVHFGFDKTIQPDGRQIVKPVHNLKAFRAMMDFAKQFKPDVVLIMGDTFDMRPVCRHEIGVPKAMEGQRLVEVYRKGFDQIIKPVLDLRVETHWFDGNHEAWAYRLIDQYPGIDGMVDPYSWLKLRDKGVEFHPQGKILKLGKLAFAHGDFIKGSSTSAAKRSVERFGSSIRIWHWHTYQAFSKETLKNMAYQTGIVVPCLCNRGPSYKKTDLTSWVNGFLYGYVKPCGDFYDSVAIVWHGQCVVNGNNHNGAQS